MSTHLPVVRLVHIVGDKLMFVESMYGHIELIAATLNDVEDWLRA